MDRISAVEVWQRMSEVAERAAKETLELSQATQKLVDTMREAAATLQRQAD